MTTIMCYRDYKDSAFLAYETYKTLTEAKVDAERYNSDKPSVDVLGNPIDWNRIKYFYADRQEAM